MKVLLQGFNHTPAMRDVAVQVLARLDQDVDVTWLARERHHADIRASGYAGELIDQEALIRSLDGAADHRTSWTFDDSDYTTLLHLLDREQFSSSYHTVDLSLQIARRSADALFDRLGVDRVVMDDVPHAIGTYVIYLAARARGVPVHFWRTGAGRHLRFISTDIEETLLELIGAGSTAGPPLPESEEFVQRLCGTYQAAEPQYMRSKKRSSRVVDSVARKLRTSPGALFGPDSVRSFNARRRRRELREFYGSLATTSLPDGKFACLFLHLQPERTSVPMGGRFAHQLLVAEALVNQLPPDWRLVVREHPSTFLPGPRLVRTERFYRVLAGLPQTDLLGMNVDPFEVIDRSSAVATLTGAVGLEAVVRGVPALAFGNAAYLGCPGVIDMRDAAEPVADLPEAIEAASCSPEGVLEFLARFDHSPAASFVDPRLSVQDPDARWSAEYLVAMTEILEVAIGENASRAE